MMRLLCTFLGVACLASAVAIIDVHHLQRQYFVALTREERARAALKVEQGRLQLEQATLSQSGRVEQIAQHRLKLTPPESTDILVIRP